MSKRSNKKNKEPIMDDAVKQKGSVCAKQLEKIIDDPLLPKKSLFRVEEAAQYFGVARSTIYLWIDHGILRAERYVNPDTHVSGTLRISRASILSCRFNARFDPML